MPHETSDFISRDDLLDQSKSEVSDCSHGPLMMAAKTDDVARLLRAMYENITVDVEWSEDKSEMDERAVKNLLRGSRLLLMDALSVYGFEDYTDALSSLGERMVR